MKDHFFIILNKNISLNKQEKQCYPYIPPNSNPRWGKKTLSSTGSVGPDLELGLGEPQEARGTAATGD